MTKTPSPERKKEKKTAELSIKKLAVLIELKDGVYQALLTEQQQLFVIDLLRQMTKNHLQVSEKIDNIIKL